MVITIEIVWLVVFGIAIVAALVDAFVVACTGEGPTALILVVLGQWIALGVVGAVLTAVLTDF